MKLVSSFRSRWQRWLVCALVGASAGCTVSPLNGTWLLRDNENTAYRTPAMRTDAIREFASRADGRNTPEQQELTSQLARQIQVEPDPLVRETIVKTIAQFRTPLAQQVLLAALDDSDAVVRRTACAELGLRGDPSGIPPLQKVIQEDESMEARLAATKALGMIPSPDAVRALASALEDRDPALQYMAVQSVQELTGEDLGGDVQAYLQYARSGTPAIRQDEPSVAQRLRGLSPF